MAESNLDSALRALGKALNKKEDKKKNKHQIERTWKTVVLIKIIYLKVGDVSTVTEAFNADIFIQARWREQSLDRIGGFDGDLADWKSYWNPQLFIENRLNMKEDVWYTVMYNERGEAFICQKWRIKGSYYERMELVRYPCDTQDLGVCVTTERGDNEVSLVFDPDERSFVNTATFMDSQEWILHTRVDYRQKKTTNVYKSSRHKHPAITLSCKATRRSRFFLLNMILILILISSLIFVTFTVSTQKIENRLQLSFILLLSNITFKFSINQTIPKVSYLTLMDKYIIGNMLNICMVCLWHALLSRINSDEDRAVFYDNIALIVLGVCYLLFNLAFLITAIVYKREQKKYEESDKNDQQELDHVKSDNIKSNAVSPGNELKPDY